MSAPKTIRKKALKVAGHQCAKCGHSDRQLDCHRIEAGGDYVLENIAVLCMTCHEEWHLHEAVSQLEFKEWLEFPTYVELLGMYVAFKENPVTREYVDYAEIAIKMRRSL